MSSNKELTATATATVAKTVGRKRETSKSGKTAEPGVAENASTRACPTRLDGPAPLFQHSLTAGQCQSKQRNLYHKCFTCAHANGRA